MNTAIEITVDIKLNVNYNELIILRGLLQNPICKPEDESPLMREVRTMAYQAFDNAYQQYSALV